MGKGDGHPTSGETGKVGQWDGQTGPESIPLQYQERKGERATPTLAHHDLNTCTMLCIHSLHSRLYHADAVRRGDSLKTLPVTGTLVKHLHTSALLPFVWESKRSKRSKQGAPHPVKMPVHSLQGAQQGAPRGLAHTPPGEAAGPPQEA